MTGDRQPLSPATAEFDHRDRAWRVDRIAKVLVFGGGISAIVFIGGILVFILTQGLEFACSRLDWLTFFTSIEWRPTDKPPTYGALALLVGTGCITGIAMVLAVPLSFGAAVYIGEFA